MLLTQTLAAPFLPPDMWLIECMGTLLVLYGSQCDWRMDKSLETLGFERPVQCFLEPLLQELLSRSLTKKDPSQHSTLALHNSMNILL